jgi:hypothetical protein
VQKQNRGDLFNALQRLGVDVVQRINEGYFADLSSSKDSQARQEEPTTRPSNPMAAKIREIRQRRKKAADEDASCSPERVPSDSDRREVVEGTVVNQLRNTVDE